MKIIVKAHIFGGKQYMLGYTYTRFEVSSMLIYMYVCVGVKLFMGKWARVGHIGVLKVTLI